MKKIVLSVRQNRTEGVDLDSRESLKEELEYSLSNGENINDWWERAHKTFRQGWLTGSKGQDIWNNLKIIERLRPGIKVLNIGVGMCYCTRELVDLGLIVHVLDISQTALDCVKDIAVCWMPDKLSKLPKKFFDIAISNLVVQHMDNRALFLQVKAVCRSLKPSGIFAIQFAQNIAKGSHLNQSIEKQKCGCVLRTNKEFIKLVERAGGKILKLWSGPTFKEYSSRWVYAHIGKSD